jgi:hypothetical protein
MGLEFWNDLHQWDSLVWDRGSMPFLSCDNILHKTSRVLWEGMLRVSHQLLRLNPVQICRTVSSKMTDTNDDPTG